MRQALKLHPDSRCTAVTQAKVEIARPRPGNLMLRYVLTGKIGDLRIPPVTAPILADTLWQNTCFEAFVKAPPSNVYYEFNFAPSTQWAAYRFDDYRSGMIVASQIATPRIDVQSSAARYALQASLELDRLVGLPSDAVWRFSLSAVIEETNGNKSYWALAHPSGSADFHHSDCFALELAAASRP
jgi:hypothetical protein